MQRINSWAVAIGVAKDNFFGSGMTHSYEDYFLKYGLFEDTPRAAHSIYFATLGNHGFVGLFLFIAIWVSTYRLAGKLRKLGKANAQAKWVVDLGSMIQVSLVAYLTGGTFLSLQYWDMPYNLAVMAMLAFRWLTLQGYTGETVERRPSPAVGRRSPTPESMARMPRRTAHR
jgi:probable O-glycosylation ligase (exosortase A-associated)